MPPVIDILGKIHWEEVQMPWRNYVFQLAWKHVCPHPPAELKDASVGRKVWVSLLRLLPPQLSSG